MTDKTVILRELSGIAELQHAEVLQIEAWGEGEKPDNSDILMALQSEGGLVGGAFRDGEMLGFVLGFPTVTPGLQHSHRLAVLPKARGLGLGASLKWFQRDWCLARGLNTVRWTYDPLRAVNAGLNIGVLGAVSNQYFVDYYGAMPGINAGLPSDRIMAVWHLEDEAVVARAEGRFKPDHAAAGQDWLEIPADIDALMAADPEKALAERLRVRDALQAAFNGGSRIVGFDRQQHRYLLGR
ncbi:GNAT family N-acetyltransferase [Cohaesibacter haloalkalitolerans]|uniref:GNAT family N-acetyltransferase n=1 Tax=Cohaesibacter haloalkalitolerans TaxID=1162980 RepID=UPI000E658074|nr:GNAT family N-acetyltransferase [Cohaesibacter haloalkalitolerans]